MERRLTNISSGAGDNEEVKITGGHKLWAGTERMSSQIQRAKMRMSGLSLTDRVRSLVIWRGLKVRRHWPDNLGRASGEELSWIYLWCNFPGIFQPKGGPREDPGMTMPSSWPGASGRAGQLRGENFVSIVTEDVWMNGCMHV